MFDITVTEFILSNRLDDPLSGFPQECDCVEDTFRLSLVSPCEHEALTQDCKECSRYTAPIDAVDKNIRSVLFIIVNEVFC